MILENLIDVLGSGEQIRIATKDGQGWLVDTTVIHFDEDPNYKMLCERKVENIYTSKGRDKTYCCCKLVPAVCIVVEGYENGCI